MAATGIETVLAAAATAIAGAGHTVRRHFAGAEFTAADCPMVLLRRGPTATREGAPLSRLHQEVTFFAHCVVAGASWETTADALHQSVHAALVANATLSSAGIDLRATEAVAAAAADTVGEVVAQYVVTTTVAETTLIAA